MEMVFGLHAVRHRLKIEADAVSELWIQFGRENSAKHAPLLESARKKNIPIKKVERDLLDKKTDHAVHQGILLLCDQLTHLYQENDLPTLLNGCKSTPFILVLDCVQDPHNLGACLRSADAAGVDFVVFPKDKSAPISATVKKVACGATESVKMVSATNLSRALNTLKEQGVWVFGLAGEGEQSLYQSDLSGAIALVMGAEGEGLRHNTKKQCDHLVKLPMLGNVSSLNVSVATGISLYEVIRQRGLH